ncbi:hypothetical protein HanOQP8_Chr06g0227081 [Helianthus annuus]|nr:hypothetical protein HanOQP8_Chr06g0227081 [Helianthus annuus]
MEIRQAVREERTIQLTFKEDGRVVHFVGVQVPIMPRRPRSESCEYDAAVAALRFCRREVCSDTFAELTRFPNLDLADHDTGLVDTL